MARCFFLCISLAILFLVAADRKEARRGERSRGRQALALEEQAPSEAKSQLEVSAQAARESAGYTESLKQALLERVSQEHGSKAATRLNSALLGKGEATEDDDEVRTKRMMALTKEDLVKFWMPTDCHFVLAETDGVAPRPEGESGDAAAAASSLAEKGDDNTEKEKVEKAEKEKALRDDCNKMQTLLYKAAIHFERVKDFDRKAEEQRTDKEAAASADAAATDGAANGAQEQPPAPEDKGDSPPPPPPPASNVQLGSDLEASEADLVAAAVEVANSERARRLAEEAETRHAADHREEEEGNKATVEVDASGSMRMSTEQKHTQSKHRQVHYMKDPMASE